MLAGGDPNEILIRNVALNNCKFCETPFPHFQNCVDFYTIKNKSDSGAPEPRGAAGATAPVAKTLRGQHGGNRLPFLPELHLEICAFFTGIGI
jgi:hypothetical protein